VCKKRKDFYSKKEKKLKKNEKTLKETEKKKIARGRNAITKLPIL